MVTISVAGDHEGSPLGQMRQAARRLPGLVRDGRHLYARSEDGSFVMHEWALEDEDDTADMAVVKMVNPASWQSVDLLRERHESPSMLPWQWQRFACGIWTGAEDWWVSGEDWDTCSEPGAELQDGDEVTLGFDGARLGDATALVACRMEDGLVVPLGVWEPPPGARDWETPVGSGDACLHDAMERYSVRRGYFDPPLWQSEIDEWAREYGDLVLRYNTNRTRMMGATERFRTDVLAGRVKHPGDATLTRHVLNAQVREARGGYWLRKNYQGSPDRIDAAVAAVLAYEARADVLAGGEEPEEVGELFTF